MDALALVQPQPQLSAPSEPGVAITIPWLAAQALPSPELAVGDGSTHFGLRWQGTPLLSSWGIHRRLSPCRFFVVEPLVRRSVSVARSAAPAYLRHGFPFSDGSVLRR